jgi:hypothetical protein
MDILKFMRKNAEVRNDEPITPGINFPKSPAPNKDAIIVPYNLALNEYGVPNLPK